MSVEQGQRCQWNRGRDGTGAGEARTCRPEVGGEDLVALDPVGVHIDQRLNGFLPLGRLDATYEDTVGVGQVIDRGSLREELGVGEDLELDIGVGAVAAEDLQGESSVR